METNPMANNQPTDNMYAMLPHNPKPAPAPQVTEVYDKMKGFLKSTHWSKPYYSSLVHNNPQLPHHLLEHVNCTYLSTPGRAPTLLALKQHAQSLAVLISLLAPSQYGGTFEPPHDGKVNADAPFAAEQAFDWLNDLQVHYNTEDRAHKKPLNALVNLIKSNSDTTGPKWHCPLDKTGLEFPEKHPFQQYRPYESHLTLLMHANEILERLDHEYSAMGGILGIIPLASENVDEGQGLRQAKTTLVGQWILYTQHLVVRMHELEIAYGNSLDLLANEAVVPMQHMSIHGPDGRSGREIVFPQDRWILANAGEDVYSFIHQMLDRAETHQDAQDDAFEEQKVLGDAAYSSNDGLKYRGIVKVDLNTRFYRLRGSGHGPLFILPAFGDRPNTKHTRDIERRPTVIAIPQPDHKSSVGSWESKHKDVDSRLLKLSIDNSNLNAKVEQLETSVKLRDREIERMNATAKQYDDTLSKEERDQARQIVFLNENIEYFRKMIKEAEERETVLKEEIERYKDANVATHRGESPVNDLMERIKKQGDQIREMDKKLAEREIQIEDVTRDKHMLQILNNPSLSNSRASSASVEQVDQLKTTLGTCHTERQMLMQEIHNLKKAKSVQGKILNFSGDLKLDYGSTFEDTNLGITAASTTFFKGLLAAEMERNDLQIKLDKMTMDAHTFQRDLNKSKGEAELLRNDNTELRNNGSTGNPPKSINIPWGLQYTSTFRDDSQGLIVLNTRWYDQLVAAEKSVSSYTDRIEKLNKRIEELKAPEEVNLASVKGSFTDKLAQAQVYRDTQQNIAVLRLGYYDELQKADQIKDATQRRLDQTERNAQILEQQVNQAKKQLDDCLKYQRHADAELPNLQNEREVLQGELNRAKVKCQGLEQQVRDIATGKPASNLESEVLRLKKEVNEFSSKVEEKDGEIARAKSRYDGLVTIEINLRNEVVSLRRQLSDAKNAAVPKAGAPAASTKGVQEVKEELEVYRSELETVQELWNDLQTQHLELQTRLEKSEKSCEDEKAFLFQKLKESADEIKVLQMKVIADPNKIQPVIIEIEAQRNAANKNRDQLWEEVKRLREQLDAKK
ncbi:hypothetical protein EKO27_g2593 [Xylaria grammica]|uniref:Uncharacterized protein n=1 Tax=Xylaria grammica TaxID=363999 RepID=A0A439DDJ9_9PEZI|nr:hypothetical protein EKO27_g2593 [Xylaria grammica]